MELPISSSFFYYCSLKLLTSNKIRAEFHTRNSAFFFTFDFVKINPLKSGNCDLALRKRLFCDAKPTLLPCKRAAFGTQNNRFCKTLTYR
ncbi:hypothetical protein CTM44_08810 [Prevotella intermedia]|nr:hypothetical protein CTM44_08810 [Prevotella intermedia]